MANYLTIESYKILNLEDSNSLDEIICDIGIDDSKYFFGSAFALGERVFENVTLPCSNFAIMSCYESDGNLYTRRLLGQNALDCSTLGVTEVTFSGNGYDHRISYEVLEEKNNKRPLEITIKTIKNITPFDSNVGDEMLIYLGIDGNNLVTLYNYLLTKHSVVRGEIIEINKRFQCKNSLNFVLIELNTNQEGNVVSELYPCAPGKFIKNMVFESLKAEYEVKYDIEMIGDKQSSCNMGLCNNTVKDNWCRKEAGYKHLNEYTKTEIMTEHDAFKGTDICNVNKDTKDETSWKEEWFWTMLGSITGVLLLGVTIYSKCCKKEQAPPVPKSLPISISLSCDKEIELIKYEDSKVCFKYDGENCKKTSWVGTKDAILFYDFDGSKEADHPSKIVLTEWSKDAKTDFQAMLEVFDTNKDRVFDKQDAYYQDFHIWQDKNSDGVVNEGELQSLKEAGIKAIDFTTTQKATPEEMEDGILNKADVVWYSGKVTTAYDLMFVHDF